MTIRIYYEKSTAPLKAWAVRYQNEDGDWIHQLATEVRVHVPSVTEGNPDAPTSQKYYMKAEGRLWWEGSIAHIDPEDL